MDVKRIGWCLGILLLTGCWHPLRHEARPYVPPVRPEVEELILQPALRKPFRLRDTAELHDALKHPFPEVRANAVYELARREDESAIPAMYSLLSDNAREVAANAAWFLHRLTGLPFQAEPAWSRGWVKHHLIERQPETELYPAAGMSTLTPEEFSQWVSIHVETPGEFREFGGEAVITLSIKNTSSVPVTLCPDSRGRYRVYQFSENGEVFVTEEGEDARAEVAWKAAMWGWVDGREPVEILRHQRFDDVGGWECIAPGDTARLDVEIPCQQTIQLDGGERRWDFFRVTGRFELGPMRVRLGERPVYVEWRNPEAAFTALQRVHADDALRRGDVRAQMFAASDYSGLWQIRSRLPALGEAVAAAFLGECFDALDPQANAAWNRFVLDVICRHVPLAPTETAGEAAFNEQVRALRGWWRANGASLTWKPETGMFESR